MSQRKEHPILPGESEKFVEKFGEEDLEALPKEWPQTSPQTWGPHTREGVWRSTADLVGKGRKSHQDTLNKQAKLEFQAESQQCRGTCPRNEGWAEPLGFSLALPGPDGAKTLMRRLPEPGPCLPSPSLGASQILDLGLSLSLEARHQSNKG